MKNKKRFILLLLAVLFAILLFKNFVVGSMSASDKDSLMRQVVEQEGQSYLYYSDYLKEDVYADAKLFGVQKVKSNQYNAYVRLNIDEYVELNGKAYNMSGSEGEAVLHYEQTTEGPVLHEIEWARDGSDYQKWVRVTFPVICQIRQRLYEAFDSSGRSYLMSSLAKQVEKEMGVSVEWDDQLEIDMDKGTYEVMRIKESGSPGADYVFDTEVVESGKLVEK